MNRDLESEHSSPLRSVSQKLNDLLKPVVVVTCLTAFLFVAGLEYYGAFLGRLSVPHLIFSMPRNAYLYMGLLSIIGGGVIFLCFVFVLPFFESKPNDFIRAFIGNLALVPIFLALMQLSSLETYTPPWLLILLTALGVLVCVLMSRKRISIMHFIRRNISDKLCVLLIAIAIALAAPLFGIWRAETLIEGRAYLSAEVRFDFKDGCGLAKEVAQKRLMLITVIDNTYYVVEYSRSAYPACKDEAPRTYAISGDVVESARFSRVLRKLWQL